MEAELDSQHWSSNGALKGYACCYQVSSGYQVFNWTKPRKLCSERQTMDTMS